MGTPRHTELTPAQSAIVSDQYNRHHKPLIHLVSRATHDCSSAQDIVQDTFFEMTRRVLSGQLSLEADPHGSTLHRLRGWLYQATINRLYFYERTKRRRMNRETLYHELVETEFCTDPVEEQRVSKLQERVWRTLDNLPYGQRALLYLSAVGLSYGELASALQMKAGSIGHNLTRARAAFRTLYLAQNQEPNIADNWELFITSNHA